ncbi:uncharacterized protein LOC9657804 isoform X1 [Selaginella moellendorffii]|uniref:uncharacterized protein LOC9657804 isoform X1 n=1 Tax=Selaginella moellendorffii TaxID=88036 RepID=UPI000D1CA6DB|nr:uncharacterized protein LOC9657804 isoform X1 [Selaginella moellendorffii]|eukprot:XP_024538998.1 uncharacterized protein LOC9657804 isoform X1 [Selaginella moellendorffii]
MEQQPELDPRLKALPFKVRASSRESASQKAAYVLDPDLRTHWSTGTNAKEWIILELEEACLLSHIRAHNKSVLEWEIAAGLKFKPESFVKVRPRCEAPRRDMTYYAGYTPCRFIRISCLRGNPIAIFYVQLMGIQVPGLEPELQPVVDYLLPRIISHKHELHAVYLKLLQDIASRLSPFLIQLESDLAVSSEAMESTVKLLAMLVGPFYPILASAGGREAEKTGIDETARTQTSVFSVSSNFQAPPKRGKGSGVSQKPVGLLLAYRFDVILLLLKVANKNSALSRICKKVAVIYTKLAGTITHDADSLEAPVSDASAAAGSDYSEIFGEEYRIVEETTDITNAGILEISLIEEGLLHVLYCLASQPVLCRRLADSEADLVPVLPFVQATVGAIRPSSTLLTGAEIIDETFWPWQVPQVHGVVSHVVSLSISLAYRPLLDACSGYLASFSAAHEKAACLLIDLCTGPLSAWLSMVICKVDLAIELLEDVAGVIQAGHKSVNKARAALLYVMLGLSGYVDELLEQYKDVKTNILFLIEILEPYLMPALTFTESTITFGDMSTMLYEKRDQNCALALDFICAAVKRFSVLPALEVEWRQGRIAPSVLLSILAPHLAIPTGLPSQDDNTVADYKFGVVGEGNDSIAAADESNLFFISPELKGMMLAADRKAVDSDGTATIVADEKSPLDQRAVDQYFDLQKDYLQLISQAERELQASEFIRFAVELHSQTEQSPESHQAAIDSLLLAAECHLNPVFMDSRSDDRQILSKVGSGKDLAAAESIIELEEERDKAVLRILLQASKWDCDLAQSVGDVGSAEFSNSLSVDAEDERLQDAATIVRQHQSQLCMFFVRQLQRDMHNLYDVLLQGLLFVLETSTGPLVPPGDLVGVILKSAERLNKSVVLEHTRAKDGYSQRRIANAFAIRRQWALLSRMVYVAAGRPFRGSDIFDGGSAHKELVPASSWLQEIPRFALSTFPLVRYIGWMSLSIYAQTYQEAGLLLASSLEQLTGALLIFSDELTAFGPANRSSSNETSEEFDAQIKAPGAMAKLDIVNSIDTQESAASVLYPEFDSFFPKMRTHFQRYADILLESVRSQIKSLAPASVPDLLGWFAEVCSDPFPQHKDGSSYSVKGFAAANVKRIVLQLLEVIVLEHMEAIVPEMPRVIRMLLKLCSSSYCDMFMLESVMSALQPLVAYAAAAGGSSYGEELRESFSVICFGALLDALKRGPQDKQQSVEGPLVIYLCGYLLPDISPGMRPGFYSSLLSWVESTKSCPPAACGKYVLAFDKILVALCSLMENSLGDGELSVYRGMHSMQPLKQAHPDSSGAEQETDFVEVGNAVTDDDGVLSEGDSLEGRYAEPPSSCSPDLLDDNVEKFLQALGPELEAAWKLHPKLAATAASTRARCLLLASYLRRRHQHDGQQDFWHYALISLTDSVAMLQKGHCWQVAAATMDYFLALPSSLHVHMVLAEVCSILQYQWSRAPRLSWRLWTVKWMPRALQHVGLEIWKPAASSSLAPLLAAMLEHPEPELRSGALQQLRELLRRNENVSNLDVQVASQRYSYDKFVRKLVSVTWDKVTFSAASDSLLGLRQQAMELLLKFIPMAEPHQLKTFLSTIDSLVPGTTSLHFMRSGPYTNLALSLLARACIYASPEDVTSIPAKVWRVMEEQTKTKPGTTCMEAGRRLCQVLLEFRTQGNVVKENLEQALLGEDIKRPNDPGYLAVRDSVLEVFARLSVLRDSPDARDAAAAEAAKELEEVKLELEMLEGKRQPQSSANDLEQLKEKILQEQREESRQQVAIRRERQRMAERDRQIALDEAAHREIVILQELDRERAAEAEREIERQKALEKEREKTRELRHVVELEMEKRSQRDYQRELEQGSARSSRRDYSASTTSGSSRPRDRDRYREGARESNSSSRPDRENAVTPPPTPPPGAAAASVSPTNVHLAAVATTTASTPVLMTNSRGYPNPNAPSFQHQDRAYEELLGNGGGISEYGEMVDERQARNSSRPRMIMERASKERSDGRREGKWERKQ